jgi:hypothetical protein
MLPATGAVIDRIDSRIVTARIVEVPGERPMFASSTLLDLIRPPARVPDAGANVPRLSGDLVRRQDHVVFIFRASRATRAHLGRRPGGMGRQAAPWEVECS